MAAAMDLGRLKALGGSQCRGLSCKRAPGACDRVAGNPAATSRRAAPQSKPAGERGLQRADPVSKQMRKRQHRCKEATSEVTQVVSTQELRSFGLNE
jgi:hypothetical protein